MNAEKDILARLQSEFPGDVGRTAGQLQADIYNSLRRHGALPVRVWEADHKANVAFVLDGLGVFITWRLPTENSPHVQEDAEGHRRRPAALERALAKARAARWSLLRMLLLVKLSAIAYRFSSVVHEFLYWIVGSDGGAAGDKMVAEMTVMPVEATIAWLEAMGPLTGGVAATEVVVDEVGGEAVPV